MLGIATAKWLTQAKVRVTEIQQFQICSLLGSWCFLFISQVYGGEELIFCKTRATIQPLCSCADVFLSFKSSNAGFKVCETFNISNTGGSRFIRMCKNQNWPSSKVFPKPHLHPYILCYFAYILNIRNSPKLKDFTWFGLF